MGSNAPLSAVIAIDDTKCVNCHACISVCPVKYCNDGSGKTVRLISETCIACGECLDACTHGARIVRDDLEAFLEAARSGEKLIAIAAPSVASSFPDRYLRLNGWLKTLGVEAVFDVSFGAELAIKSYVEHLEKHSPTLIIAQPCPALVNYIELYRPELLEYLAPADSPMAHTLKMIERYYPQYRGYKTVAISPCVAKKREFEAIGYGNFNVTMARLKAYLAAAQVDLSAFAETDYANPPAERAVLFSTPGGLLRTVERWNPGIRSATRKIEGPQTIYRYLDTLYDMVRQSKAPVLVDGLNCEMGCNGGTGTGLHGTSPDEIESHVEARSARMRALHEARGAEARATGREAVEQLLAKYWEPGLYSRSYVRRPEAQALKVPSAGELQGIYAQMDKHVERDFYNCASCGYDSCEKMAVAIFNGLNKPDNCHHFLKGAQDRILRKAEQTVAQRTAEIRVKETRFRELFENMNDCVAVFDPADEGRNLVFSDVNSAFLRTERLAREAVVGRLMTEVFPGEASADLLKVLLRVFDTGTPEALPARFYQDDRISGWREHFVYRLPTNEVVAVYRDVSAEKHAEAALRASLESTEMLIDRAPIALVVVGKDQRIRRANEVAGEILGVAPAEMVGQDWRVFAPDSTKETSSKSALEGVLKDNGGNAIAVLMSVIPATVGGEEVVYIEAFLDLTERKQLESQLQQSQKLEAVGQLAAGIAHEINTPTQFVGDNTRFVQQSFQTIQETFALYTEILEAAKTNSVTPELVARAEQAAVASDLDFLFAEVPDAISQSLEGIGRIAKIVRAMKEFSHPGAKEKAHANLNRAIESTVTVASSEWKFVADVTLDLDPQLPLVVCFLGDFNQAMLNLIVNAAHTIGDVVKQNPRTKGTIAISTRRDGAQVEVRVADTGAGIPEEARPRLFEPFFTTKELGKGTGQGLSVVYGAIVKRHGGSVTFESEVGKGTTFIIRLPIEPGR